MKKENFRVLITAEQIAQKIGETARLLERDYKEKDLILVAVMKGAICLVADLLREINLPITLEFIQCSSYGANGGKRGELKIFGLDHLHLKNKDLLIVDDIFDTGHTMQGLYDAFTHFSPRSIRSCVLLEKNVSHCSALRPDYSLFHIEDDFVIGYGLDYKEQYRGLTSICIYPH